MSEIWALARKDLVLVLRDRFGLFWMLAFPLLLALFFGFLSGGGGRDRAAMPVAVVDEDDTDASRALVRRLEAKAVPKDEAEGAPPAPLLQLSKATRAEAERAVRKGELVAYVVLPKGSAGGTPFGPVSAPLEIGYDPRRGAEVGFLQGILMETIYAGLQDGLGDARASREQFAKAQKDLAKAEKMPPGQKAVLTDFLRSLSDFLAKADPKVMDGGPGAAPARVKMEAVSPDRARPVSAFEVTFPSSVLWGIIGCVMTFAIGLVIERMEGTFLRLRFAPVSWGQMLALAGKGLACWLSCAGVAVVLLVIGRLFFRVRVDIDRLPLLLLGVACTAACFTGMMMLVSTLGTTPGGAAGAAWGILMPLAMLGGGMIPLIAMPNWLYQLSSVSPVKWGILALEGAIWRNFGLVEMLLPCGILLGVGAAGFVIGANVLSLRETGRRWPV